MKALDRMVWVDIETTGLDPEKDAILELGIIITDASLNITAEKSWVLKLPTKPICDFHPAVLEMHGRTGLFVECAKSEIRRVDVEHDALQFIGAYGGPICGSSPHFDMGFLRQHMSMLAKLFNYRVFDVSSLRQAFCNNLMQMLGDAPVEDKDNNQHRALADLKWSIARAKELITFMRKGMYSTDAFPTQCNSMHFEERCGKSLGHSGSHEHLDASGHRGQW